MRLALPIVALLLGATTLPAQAPDDGLMMPRKTLSTGVMYAHDSWSEYWEGTLKRSNGNIGTLTTQTTTLVGLYGVTNRLSVIAMVPYVTTDASDGTLHGLSGVQDVTLAAKYRLFATPLTNTGTLSALLVGAAGIPASDYTPDYQPLSIGLASRRATGRFTLHFETSGAWFVEGSAAHTWRNKVRLDRPAYYTNGQLFLTNEVEMPQVAEYKFSTGFRRKRLFIPLSITQQRTLGGGDIRRQDMPFVSNRMDFIRGEGSVVYGLTVPTDLGVQLGIARTLTGRNVGQSTTLMLGLMHTFHL